jgi:(R,R)-butanediol dehydrogenase/meso-butanediol dehydrogenase/diacetyl reductase
MKAAVFKARGVPLAIEEVADPRPGPEELVLKVCACGICGTDLHWASMPSADETWRPLLPGSILGHEFAGEVVEVGRDLRGQWKEGERVCAQPFVSCGSCRECLSGRGYRCAKALTRASTALPGAYAAYTRVGAHETLRLPDSVDFSEGALVEPLAVGLAAVRRARLAQGDTVLIVGGGPVGLSVALFCRFFGARHVVVSDLVKQRAERAAEFGATAAIDARNEDVAARFRQLTGGGPSVVFDAVGVPGSLQIAVDYAENYSRLVVVGLCMAQDTFFPARAIKKELDISFAFVYSKADFEFVIEMLAKDRIDASGLISDRVGFAAFPAAFEALKRPTDQIKVMLTPD